MSTYRLSNAHYADLAAYVQCPTEKARLRHAEYLTFKRMPIAAAIALQVLWVSVIMFFVGTGPVMMYVIATALSFCGFMGSYALLLYRRNHVWPIGLSLYYATVDVAARKRSFNKRIELFNRENFYSAVSAHDSAEARRLRVMRASIDGEYALIESDYSIVEQASRTGGGKVRGYA